MPDAANTDCYLCGARNDLDSDFCVRCDGQLLKLPTDALDLASADAEELIDDTVVDVEEDVVQEPRRRRVRTGSVEDQRLSDALGLTTDDDENDDVDPSFIDTLVTGVPQARQSTAIPMIGTSTGAIPQSAMTSQEFGIRTYVLLALLLVSTAWLGWTTLSGDNSSGPENLAFTDTTLPIATTTTSTTEVQRRGWSEAEASGTYGAAFHRVLLYDCPAENANGEPLNIEPIDDLWTSGIAVDEHNAVIAGGELPSANVAIIQSRTGARRLATIEPGPRGTRVATTASVISRNLDLREAPDGDATYFLTYDMESNVVETSDESAGQRLEIVVTNVGDPLRAQVGFAQLQFDDLIAINRRVEVINDEDAPNPTTICDRASRLFTMSTESANEPIEANEQ